MGEVQLNVRDQFLPYMHRKERWACLVCHRRAGKTFSLLLDLLARALAPGRATPIRRYGFVAPTREQAKQVVWSYLIDFAAELERAKLKITLNRTELCMRIGDLAEIRLYSGENYERARGLYFDGLCLDEAADIPADAFKYVFRPALQDYNGWCTWLGTPKGQNAFYRIYERARRDPDWYTLFLPASQSGIFSPEELDAMERELGHEAYRQEMECDFTVARANCVFAHALNEAREAGRIREIGWRPNTPVFTSWDLGATVNTVVLHWQLVGDEYHVIDCDDGTSVPAGKELTVSERVSLLLGKPWAAEYHAHLLPHDAAKVELSGVDFATQLRNAHLRNVVVVPREPRDAVLKRNTLALNRIARVHFDKQLDAPGGLIDALSQYHRRVDKLSGDIRNEVVEDWTAHRADAFGTLFQAEEKGLLNCPRPRTAEPIRASMPTRRASPRQETERAKRALRGIAARYGRV